MPYSIEKKIIEDFLRWCYGQENIGLCNLSERYDYSTVRDETIAELIDKFLKGA